MSVYLLLVQKLFIINMSTKHTYDLNLQWTGNTGNGTINLNAYKPSHSISQDHKATILCSTPPVFGGEQEKYSPEELLISSLSSCHMVIYLYLCAINKVNVIAYSDNPAITMEISNEGKSAITQAILNPHVVVSDTSMLDKANELHHEANTLCPIANACKFAVHHSPTSTIETF